MTSVFSKLPLIALALTSAACVETAATHENEPAPTTSTASLTSATAEIPWSYDGATGPAHWGDLAPEFGACKSGTHQSPIALFHREHVPHPGLTALQFEDPPSPIHLVNDGHTVLGSTSLAEGLTTPHGHYKLVQFHFHVPSEHTLDGRHYDAEMHLVHQNEQGERAVVAFFFSIHEHNNDALASFCDHPPTDPNQETSPTAPIDLMRIVNGDHTPHAQSYLTYGGSLTTPACTEGITWFVFTSPRFFGRTQWENLYGALHGHTNRPIQPRNGRVVSRFDL
ncbi:carbonic anhydrase family protein [Pendulispora rubella]|uniref:Carbonic anhydrase n=1 Tax=Pendulispora rubella TaxID=2741070 RepID=A0ABZ2KRW8_9BACT